MSTSTPRRGGRAGFIALAVVMMVLGVIAALSGGALLMAFGPNGQITSDTHPVTTSSAAVITDLTWNVRDGADRMVLMNPDSPPGVSARLRIGVGLPGAFGLAIGFLVGGLVLLAGGLAILMFAGRRPANPYQAPAPATS